MTNKTRNEFLGDNSVDGRVIGLKNAQWFRILNAAGTAWVNAFRLNANDKFIVNQTPIVSDDATLENVTRALMTKGQMDTAIGVESSRAQTAEAALGNRVDLEITNRQAGDTSTLAAAKAYTDQGISNLLGGLPPSTLDTIAELAAALQNDQSGIAAIMAQLTNHETRIVALEARPQPLWATPGKITVDATIATNGYFDLPETIPAALIASLSLQVDAFYIHVTDDYTLSTVGGKTRVTMANAWVPGGLNALSAGISGPGAVPADNIYYRYQKY